MFTFLFSFLNAAGETAGTTSNVPATGMAKFVPMLGQFLPFILIAVVFYFFIIRPQNKQRQMLTQMINNLKPGNKIITKGGLIGTVEEILENSFIIKIHDGSKIEILKNAVISMFQNKE